MTFHPGRRVRLCFLLLTFALSGPSALDWWREHQLPAGYGAEGDRRRAVPMPGPVRSALESLSADAEGSWVKGCVEGGAWVYQVHVDRGNESSVLRVSANGDVIRPTTCEPEPGDAVEAGE